MSYDLTKELTRVGYGLVTRDEEVGYYTFAKSPLDGKKNISIAPSFNCSLSL